MAARTAAQVEADIRQRMEAGLQSQIESALINQVSNALRETSSGHASRRAIMLDVMVACDALSNFLCDTYKLRDAVPAEVLKDA